MPGRGGASVEWAISDGPVAYEGAVGFMESRSRAIAEGNAAEMVWLLEHPALYTAGTSARLDELVQPSRLPVHQTRRGGRLTYHGPGQRIAYLMLDLKARGGDVRRFVEHVSLWVIDTLETFNVHGVLRPGRVGVWVERPDRGPGVEDKVAAIGLRVSRAVTSHGISLNVDPDLAAYAGIVPCGIHGHGVTSFADLGYVIGMESIDMALRSAFERRFGPTRSVAPPGFGEN